LGTSRQVIYSAAILKIVSGIVSLILKDNVLILGRHPPQPQPQQQVQPQPQQQVQLQPQLQPLHQPQQQQSQQQHQPAPPLHQQPPQFNKLQ